LWKRLVFKSKLKRKRWLIVKVVMIKLVIITRLVTSNYYLLEQ